MIWRGHNEGLWVLSRCINLTKNHNSLRWSEPLKLEGEEAIVAGGGQGIGEGIVKCPAEEGANIAVVDINGDNANKVADAVKAMGRKTLAITADLTNDDEVTRVVKETVSARDMSILRSGIEGQLPGWSKHVMPRLKV